MLSTTSASSASMSAEPQAIRVTVPGLVGR
jgi:hypothetical protein